MPFSDELKSEFYHWLSAVKIDNNNCPRRLKHLLYGFNEVLEGRGEKLQEGIENMDEKLDSNSPEYMEQLSKVFVHVQAPMRQEAEEEKSLRGKTSNDIKIRKKFNGDNRLGKNVLNKLTDKVSNNDFEYFPQKKQQKIQNFINDPKNWKLDEIPIEVEVISFNRKKTNWKDRDYLDNGETREGLEKWIKELEVRKNVNDWGIYEIGNKLALINKSALNRDGYITDPSKVYYKDRDLSAEGWVRIEDEKNQTQNYNQAVNQKVSFSHPTNSNNNLPKPLIFVSLFLLTLTIGIVSCKLKRNKFKR